MNLKVQFFNSDMQLFDFSVNIYFTNFPRSQKFFLSSNNLTGSIGATLNITPENIGLKCLECDQKSLWINVIFVVNGHFALAVSPLKSLRKFSYEDLKSSFFINLFHSGQNIKNSIFSVTPKFIKLFAK